MARFHATSEGNVPFTAEEELEADQREADWLIEQERLKIPKSVKKWKILVTLEKRGLRTEVEAIAASNPIVKIIYDTITEFERDNTLIATMAPLMNWDAAYIDALFIEADRAEATL